MLMPLRLRRAPANADVWLRNLVKPEVQGCGHIRLMLSADTAPFYSVQLNSTGVADCQGVDPSSCIDSAAVAAEVINQFFR